MINFHFCRECTGYKLTVNFTINTVYNCLIRHKDKTTAYVVKLKVALHHFISTEKPKPTVRVNPQSSVYTGDRVTLTCNLLSTGWTFLWYKDYQESNPLSPGTRNTNTLSVTVTNEGVTRYYCKARRGNYDSAYSDPITITVRARPKFAVKVQPAERVFIGETVTLTCEIQTGESWRYLWYRNNEELSDAAGKKTHTISHIKASNKGDYTCKGTQSSDPKHTQSSDAVTLTVSGECVLSHILFIPLTVKSVEVYFFIVEKRFSHRYVLPKRHINRLNIFNSSGKDGEKPKPQLTSDLKGAALTGNSVTLSCTLKPQSDGWKFYWNKPTQSTETETHSYTIRSVSVSDGGQYWCRAGRGNPVYYTDNSNELQLKVTESPKPVMIIKPDTQVFRGERVTFRCDIQGGDTEWTYDWYRDDNTFYTYHTTLEIIISDYYSGKYTCRGKRRSDSQISKTSDPVILSVSEKPKPELISDLKGAALTGNSVILSCTLKLQSDGLKFYWIKPTQSTETETKTQYYFIRSVSVSDGGQYRCRAGRGNPVYYTDYSDALWVNVTGESPPVSLIINPSRTQHFTADSLSLSCEDQSDSTGWTVRGYTHSETVSDCSSVSGSTCNISSLSTSHTGVYWCQSESGRRSNPVNITVHNGDVILESPVHPVTEGRPLTLRCLHRNSKISDSGVDFYKNDSVLQSQTTGEMTISTVSMSDEGFYHCKHPERGESPKSWISVRSEETMSSYLN
ncbi:carcinoembryonic antigen-related cell adhesion molecule 5-like [Ictalurus furcatus]|uniref:carcinoembryonic antigen-related cell adhesion molecule 5-like n=1 Tax=Ictalurus furcatus TaxID=66913 RepID=UPI002350BD91|nr:carcinoembryonic antigen-related cell adhesion molecule 5-like [Ictalurus furcatus]